MRSYVRGLAAAGFMLCAIASTPVLAAKKPTLEQLVATHGYVYVNLPKGGAIPTALTIRKVGETKAIALELRKDADLHAYGAWVPAGDYNFAGWDGLPWGEHETFAVAAGRISDLGSIVPIGIGGYEFVPFPMRPIEVSGRVADAVKEFEPHASAEVLAWNPQQLPKTIKVGSASTGLGLIADLLMAHDHKVNKPPLSQRLRNVTDSKEFLSLAKTTMAPISEDGVVDAQGNLYLPADLGQIRVRTPAGEWSSLDTGSIWSVTALSFVDGTLFAGAQNLVLKANAERSAWQTVAAFPSAEWVTSVHRVDAGWLVTTLEATVTYRAPSVKAARIYLAKSEDLSDRTVLKEVVVDDKKAVVNYRTTGAAVLNGYYFANAFNELIRIKLDTMQVESITPPTMAHGFKISASSGTMTAYHVMGAFSKLFVSNDNGTTWIKKDAPPYVIRDVHFASLTEGHALRARAGAFIVTQELLTYDAAKDAWTKTLDAPEGCVRIVHDASEAPTICVTNGGSLLYRKEAEWTAEFSVE